MRKEFTVVQDAHSKLMEEQTTKLDECLAALNIDIDMELFPHMLTAVASRRWVIGHGFRLGVMKFKESYECQSRLGKAILLKRNDASLNLVVSEPSVVAYGSQPISLALTVQALTVNASMTATSLISALSLLQVVPKAAGDSSALTVVMS
ncbi:hypothetical protein Tco_1451546 [Tanacetum coccineum]